MLGKGIKKNYFEIAIFLILEQGISIAIAGISNENIVMISG